MEWVAIIIVGVATIYPIYANFKVYTLEDCERLIQGRLGHHLESAVLRKLTLWQLRTLRRRLSESPHSALNDAYFIALIYDVTHALSPHPLTDILSGFMLRPKAERWLISLSFWIPRQYREAITGDILEDCQEMRDKGFSERRIRIHVLWQFTIALIALWPEAIGSTIAAIVKRVWKTKQ